MPPTRPRTQPSSGKARVASRRTRVYANARIHSERYPYACTWIRSAERRLFHATVRELGLFVATHWRRPTGRLRSFYSSCIAAREVTAISNSGRQSRRSSGHAHPFTVRRSRSIAPALISSPPRSLLSSAGTGSSSTTTREDQPGVCVCAESVARTRSHAHTFVGVHVREQARELLLDHGVALARRVSSPARSSTAMWPRR